MKQTNKLQFLLTFSSRLTKRNLRKGRKERNHVTRDGDDDDEGNDENDYEYIFLCNRWLAKNEDDGKIVRELVPSTKSGLKRRSTLSGEILFSK